MNSTEKTEFETSVRRIRDGLSTPEAEAERIRQLLTAKERLWLLDGDTDFWAGLGEMMVEGYNFRPIVMGAIERLGIPGLRFSDGPRGVVMGASTAFPVSMARGATWDLHLEEEVGRAIGREVRAQGANFFAGVCINLPRHPAWGRAQETYAEDPILLGEFGAALIRGVRENAMAVVKHYALNSMENARFSVDVDVDDDVLHEVYLPHFRRALEAGADGVMTSYNSVNGEWAGQNEYLMEGVLRSTWGFEGVTVSDFMWGFRDAGRSLRAGLDVEEPFRQQRAQHLADDIQRGEASNADVDRAIRRILRTQLAFLATLQEDATSLDVVFSPAHRELARTVAQRSMVLLKNELVENTPVLPLDSSSLASIALVGRLASTANTGDHGSSDVRSPEVVTPADGLRAALPGVRLNIVDNGDPGESAAAAANSDVAVVVVGYTAADEGEFVIADMLNDPALMGVLPPLPDGMTEESLRATLEALAESGEPLGGDRASLRLRDEDVAVIRATAAANPRTVVVVVTAGAVITEEWRSEVPAVVVSWYSGAEGGHALWDLLLGTVDATGRLPYAIPTSEDHLPFFDRDATSIRYDRWFGQRLLDRDGNAAAFPLGFGLSYTTFAFGGVTASEISDDTFTAHVVVKNTGERAGRQVVQIYGLLDVDDLPHRQLLGFTTVPLDPGQSAAVTVPCSIRPLQRWTGTEFLPSAATARIEAASYSGASDAVTTHIRLTN
ncbi:glycoside hydrolase family 3 protein [Leifsonia aquatica]|uniref:glycoside hydrolase family 3 protein n=1 Tax=Leifsonia aquatica TaxID=144185 RepID=UPI00046AAD6E|nr:glycoside hydrolase family 3 C-terminal domain-containing protein [Leifsonia aquatica]